MEFALGTNPANSSSRPSNPPVISDVDGSKYLTITTLVRAGAQFAGSSPSASIDGIDYVIEGGQNLTIFNSEVVSMASPAGLPTPPADYEFKSFRLATPISASPKAFLRVKVSETPQN
jgi:hypothetical protein